MSGRSAEDPRRRGAGAALGALAAIGLVTAAWWALALWPAPASPPPWLVTARSVCFGAAADGLPDAAGWLVLVGQPLGMVALLVAIAGGALRDGLRRLAGSGVGRVALAGGAAVALAVAAGAGLRVSSAAVASEAPPRTAVDTQRLRGEAPPLPLTDQHGAAADLSRFRGRPVLVAFAYGHCTTVCPLAVREVLRARDLAADLRPAVVIVTLDPWRDTPDRLPHVARRWGLDGDAFLLGGRVDEVEAALHAWRVPRWRDERTGEVVHPPTVYVVDGDGTLAYATRPAAPHLERLLRSLAGRA